MPTFTFTCLLLFLSFPWSLTYTPFASSNSIELLVYILFCVFLQAMPLLHRLFPYFHGTNGLLGHFTDLRRTFLVGQFCNPPYQQSRHICRNETNTVKLQGFIQQMDIVLKTVFFHHLIYCPTVAHLAIHHLYSSLAGSFLMVLLPVPLLHQHPVIPFQKLFVNLAEAGINIFL